MRTQMTTTNIACFGMLGAAALISIMLPSNLGPRSSVAKPPTTITGDTTLDVNTIVRDFKKDNVDFGGGIPAGNGHYAGNVLSSLSSSGRPVFVGVAPSPINDFVISNSALKPQKPFAAMVSVIGAAIRNTSAGYDNPVSLRLTIGGQTFDPFGPYDKAVAGNVNDGENPRKYVFPNIFPANTAVQVSGRSWEKISNSGSGSGMTVESNWQTHYAYSTSSASTYIKVLRNGDAVPNLTGFMGQLDAKQMLVDYVNSATQKMTLKPNQVIYLFELGVTDLTSSAADFQDVVVLVTLGETVEYLESLDSVGNPPAVAAPKGYKVATQWRDSQSRPIAPHLMGTATGDVAGTKGVASSGGITSVASFDQWYSDVMGKNLSSQVALKLKKNSAGVWEYLSDAFHPIDSALLGNEGMSHNFYFTLNFGIDFTHHAGEHRFFEFQGDDDVWLFVDGKLAMDLGGISPGVKQYLDVDRLGLSDGVKHHIEFFYAQRQESNATFRLRSNLDFGAGTTQTYTVTSTGD